MPLIPVPALSKDRPLVLVESPVLAGPGPVEPDGVGLGLMTGLCALRTCNSRPQITSVFILPDLRKAKLGNERQFQETRSIKECMGIKGVTVGKPNQDLV
jgi:hypothetical protein